MTDTKPMTGQDSVPLPSAENLREREEYTAYLASEPPAAAPALKPEGAS